jgi:hypothetical protein
MDIVYLFKVYTRDIRKVKLGYFRQLMFERERVRACEVASDDSLSCKPPHSVCSCLYSNTVYCIECGMIDVPSFMIIGTGIQAILRFRLRNLRGCNVGNTDGTDL